MPKIEVVMTLSHWGQFEAPVRFLPCYLANMGKDVIRPIERFDGEKWKLVALRKNGIND